MNWYYCDHCDNCQGHEGGATVPDTGTFIVVDGVVTEDPDADTVRQAFGCIGGCR